MKDAPDSILKPEQAAYLDALPRLSSHDLRATAASIVTTEAEHASVLLGALGRPQVPTAFVVGKR